MIAQDLEKLFLDKYLLSEEELLKILAPKLQSVSPESFLQEMIDSGFVSTISIRDAKFYCLGKECLKIRREGFYPVIMGF